MNSDNDQNLTKKISELENTIANQQKIINKLVIDNKSKIKNIKDLQIDIKKLFKLILKNKRKIYGQDNTLENINTRINNLNRK
jgi:uncharacterized coiled-coil protein SlyX